VLQTKHLHISSCKRELPYFLKYEKNIHLIEIRVSSSSSVCKRMYHKIICSFSIIGNEDQMSAYELHIGVKDYCFGRDDRLIGVSVMQLKDIMDQVPCNYLLCNARPRILCRRADFLGKHTVVNLTANRMIRTDIILRIRLRIRPSN
jgi:hypothetical protein